LDRGCLLYSFISLYQKDRMDFSNSANHFTAREYKYNIPTFIGRSNEVRLLTEVPLANSAILGVIEPCVELFDFVENSGLVDMTPEAIFPDIPFPGKLSGKKFKIPLKMINTRYNFFPAYVEAKQPASVETGQGQAWQRYVIDIASPDTIFNGPLLYLNFPNSPHVQTIIINNNLQTFFESPQEMISLESIEEWLKTRAPDSYFGPMGNPGPENFYKFSKEDNKYMKDNLDKFIKFFPKVEETVSYLLSLSYSPSYRRTYILNLSSDDLKILTLPHNFERISNLPDKNRSTRIDTFVRLLATVSGKPVPRGRKYEGLKLEEYSLPEIATDTSESEIKRLYSIITEATKGQFPPYVYRLFDMIMCIASRGFGDELVALQDEEYTFMVQRVFKSHLDQLPYVRTPPWATGNLTSNQKEFISDLLRNYQERRAVALKDPHLAGGVLKALRNELSAPLPSIPQDISREFATEIIHNNDVFFGYTLLEKNRGIDMKLVERNPWDKRINSYFKVLGIYFEALPPKRPGLNLDRQMGTHHLGQLKVEYKERQALHGNWFNVNGVQFTHVEINIFNNTPIYDAFYISGENNISFPSIRLADLKLFKQFLKGRIMLRTLYEGLSDSAYKILSSDFSFLKYSELTEVRNYIDRNFSCGLEFYEQVFLSNPQTDLERVIAKLFHI